MPEIVLENILAECKSSGYIIAPAGFGKTHLIAKAVKLSNGTQLILTHTFAGVNALKKKMQNQGVPTKKYHIDTIASWSLKLCLAYTKNSKWNYESPANNEQWTELYNKCSILLRKDFVKRIIISTYSGIYVDEYQDCTIAQHNLITGISDIIPCRFLGDPLQAIFDFNDNPVKWEENIYPYYPCLGELNTPWRWKNSNNEYLGNWLIDVRNSLLEKGNIDLSKKLPKNVIIKRIDDNNNFSFGKPDNLYYEMLKKHKFESIAVIFPGAYDFKRQTHKLARSLNGAYSSIEEVEGNSMFSFINTLSNANSAKEKLEIVLKFAKDCLTKINDVLPAGTKRFEIVTISKSTKFPLLAEAVNNYYNNPSSANLLNLLELLNKNEITRLFRRDLFYRTLHVLRIHSHTEGITLKQAAERFQREFRNRGRPIINNKIIGTTLLVKGLEYDHVIVVNAQSLSKKQLYVALTRGAKSITIFTNENILPPP